MLHFDDEAETPQMNQRIVCLFVFVALLHFQGVDLRMRYFYRFCFEIAECMQKSSITGCFATDGALFFAETRE